MRSYPAERHGIPREQSGLGERYFDDSGSDAGKDGDDAARDSNAQTRNAQSRPAPKIIPTHKLKTPSEELHVSLFSLVQRRSKSTSAAGTNRQAIDPAHHADDLQFCKIISQFPSEQDADRCAQAWNRLQQTMALVPSGATQLEPNSLSAEPDNQADVVNINAFYIDRLAVTNADFAAFVASGVYDDMEQWPSEVWQHVLQFVDRSGVPGPQSWLDGKVPREASNLPVIGICWYEAMVFAKWAGKRLPDAAQWQRAASWHTGQNGQQTALSYPWGNSFDSSKANTWSSGVGKPVAVDRLYEGCTPNGVHQLIGNVWEWVDEAFVIPWNDNHLLAGFAEVRGGAFDTYFESQTRCQFRSGLPLLFRGANVGFRCCVNLGDLKVDQSSTALPSDLQPLPDNLAH